MKPELISSKKTLLKGDINFDPASSNDKFGRLFRYKNQVYRSVSPEFHSIASKILERAPYWAAYGLVQTTESGYKMENVPLVLSHRTIEFCSYCTEWLPEMLKDAAVTYLQLQHQLVTDGYILKDGHPWNLLFDQGQPVYVDIGSILPFDETQLTRSLQEFRIYFLLPLMLFSKWGSTKTYAFLNRPIPNPDERERVAQEIGLASIRIPRWFSSSYGLKRMISKIERMKFPGMERTEWSNYEQKSPDLTNPDSFVEKQHPAYEILRRISSGTLLDIGCNKGWYSLLAESMGFSVVSIDIDLESLTFLYKKVKSERKHILPLYVDISEPTRASGLDGAYPAFMDRMKYDVVFAMAIIHHLAYKSKLSFETFARRIAQLTRKVAVVEFIPREDMFVSKWNQERMEWYTREYFIESFMRHFDHMEASTSTPYPREVFVFEKKTTNAQD